MMIDEEIIFLLIYPITKFVFYVFWCAIGVYIFTNKLSLSLAIKLGAFRWGLGLVFGFFVFIFFRLDSGENAGTAYLMIYTPLRIIEWGIILLKIESLRDDFFAKFSTNRLILWSILWVIGGIIVSYATDLVSPEGLEGRFCVGRCLC